jgi:glycerol-3-phosphate dehydrogenase
MADFDLAIIGGGINGAGIARDAAGRGLKVVLVEQGDLASGTSSVSSKLIHGGLRYLEHGALRLVRAALSEREVLLRMAPHLIRPLRFVLPLDTRYRSPALLRFGLFIYDKLGRREILPPTRDVDLAVDATGVPLRRHFHRGFEYSDCFADDARLVVLNALDAAERGAEVRTRTRCVRRARQCLAAHPQRPRRPRSRDRTCTHQRRGRVGGHRRRNSIAAKAVRAPAARQGQPHRRAEAL